MFVHPTAFVTALLISSSALLPSVLGIPSAVAKKGESCEGHRIGTKHGKGLPMKTGDSPVYFLDPEQSACGPSYRNTSNVACVHAGWLGLSELGTEKGCFRWIELTNSKGVKAQAQVMDQCGGDPKIKFDCESVYVSVETFKQLSTTGNDLELGHITGGLSWEFIDPSCWACYSGGHPGNLPNGEPDHCQGPDHSGFTRCGRKSGSQRISGDGIAKVCNNKYTCPKPNTL